MAGGRVPERSRDNRERCYRAVAPSGRAADEPRIGETSVRRPARQRTVCSHFSLSNGREFAWLRARLRPVSFFEGSTLVC